MALPDIPRRAAKEKDDEKYDSTTPSPVPSSTAAIFTPTTIISTVVLTTLLLSAQRIYSTRLLRIPNTAHLQATYLQSRPTRSIFGLVTSVGDADNFRVYHTPGGMLLGWHWLRSTPDNRKALTGQTLHIRIAGIDAPELAHFGKPAQPFADKAMQWLTKTVMDKRVRVYTLRRDQYERVVATAFMRRDVWGVLVAAASRIPGFTRDKTTGPLFRRDIGLEMIRAGWATVYEAKYGAEFGQPGMETVYREAERKAKLEGRGMWQALYGGVDASRTWDWLFSWLPWRPKRQKKIVELESPRAFKTRMAKLDESTKTKPSIPSKK